MMRTNILDRNNINYTKAVMYRTVSNDFQPGEPFDYDMLLFFSPMGIDSLLKNFPEFHQNDIQIGRLEQQQPRLYVTPVCVWTWKPPHRKLRQ